LTVVFVFSPTTWERTIRVSHGFRHHSILCFGCGYSFRYFLHHSKAALMEKVQSDNPSWTEDRLEEEVRRFMMDQEGANMYIKYLKDKKMNPRDYVAEAEAELSLSNPRTVCAVSFVARIIAGLYQ
jgi:hypothetical protein